MKINPELPTVGSDKNTWGAENNAAHAASIAQGNSHDDRLAVLEGKVTGPRIRLDTDGTPYYVPTMG